MGWESQRKRYMCYEIVYGWIRKDRMGMPPRQMCMLWNIILLNKKCGKGGGGGGRGGGAGQREMFVLWNIILLNKKWWEGVGEWDGIVIEKNVYMCYVILYCWIRKDGMGESPELTSHILLKFCFLFKYITL